MRLELARRGGETDMPMIDAPPQVPRHGVQPEAKNGGRGRLIGRTRGGLTSKLHAVTDALGPLYDEMKAAIAAAN